MDDEVDRNEEDGNLVLAQESAELFDILRVQSLPVIMQLCQMMPQKAGWDINHLTSSPTALSEHITAMLEYFRLANIADCCKFLQSMCLLCENIPMRLETRLMSVAGYAQIDEISRPSETIPESPSPPSEQQLIKRPRIDHWEQYIASAKSLLLGRWEKLSELLVTEVLLENVWVSPRAANRSRERPFQTPGSTDKGSRTPEPDGDYGSTEARVTLETFLQGCSGKVTVLLGPAGSGKTLLMSCLGQQWARGLGPIPSSSLLVLLEFRQLSLLSRPVSLSELLFGHYLPTRGGEDEKKAIVDYLLSNPEQSCWVLDGYDEFHTKLTKEQVQKELLDPTSPLPVEELITGLLNRQLLPGCTVVITCRVRDVMDLEGISDKVGQLLGWDCQEIKEYMHSFFGVKGHQAKIGAKAEQLLLSNRHLLAMSSLPGLCNICCICLEHLLLKERDQKGIQMATERGSHPKKTAREKEVKEVQFVGGVRGAEGSARGSYAERRDHEGGRRSGDKMMDVSNGSNQLSPTPVQIPSTLTQVYLTVLSAFMSRNQDKDGRNGEQKDSIPQLSVAKALSQYQSELCELSQLAWRGLEDSKILFMEEEISQHVLEFSIRTGLFSQVEVRREDGLPVNVYVFTHLTLQEFLGAVRIMTSQDVSDMQLRKRFCLKTRWTTKSDQRTVFTDSLHLFVCGLASPHCTQALVSLASTSSGSGQSWVQGRQALALKLLKNLCRSNTLTGPKVLELCHCIQESQDQQLAKQVVLTRRKLELRNIRLLPNDVDALAFVVNSVGDIGIGLDFGACSMDLECLDALTKCQYIHYLSFRSRKYGDKFAEKLSTVLPQFKTLRKLELCGASLTTKGAASLASALQDCPQITEINLSDNNLKDEGIEHIVDVLAKLPKLDLMMLGRNNSSLKAFGHLIRKISSCFNIRHIHADGMKELTVNFSQSSGLSPQIRPEPKISLLNQKWSKQEIKELSESLASCSALSILDLSGGQWELETLRTLTDFLPKFNITKKIILNESCSSLEGLVVLTALLSDCPAVMELHIRLLSPIQTSVVFSGGREKPVDETSKTLCLSCCGLLPADLEEVCKSLVTSSDLTVIDLSSNCLDNKGLKKLLEFMPQLRSIRKINASNNGTSMTGVVMLAGALGSHSNLRHVHISDGGRDKMILKFSSNTSADEQQLKSFRFNNSRILPNDISALCRRLVLCHSHLELDFSHSSLTDKAIENLLNFLPRMTSLQSLNLSHSISSPSGAVMLAGCLTVCPRVKSVEIRPQLESFIHFDSLKAEQASCRLTGFSLNGNDFERLLKVLQQGPQLFYLDLSSNQLEDKGVKLFLDTLPKLKVISYANLSSNILTKEGLLDMVNTLCTCDNISGVEVSLGIEQRCLLWFTQEERCEMTLSIREGSLERDHLIRLAKILSVCPSMTKLELRNNHLDSDWIEDFVKLLNGSQTGLSVSIEEFWIRSEEAVTLLSRCLKICSNIQTIRVHKNTLHLSLMKDTKLTTVSLVDCAVEGFQLAPLRDVIQMCPFLTELDFTHNRLGIEGAEFLSSVLPSLPNLTSISIGSKETSATVAEKLSDAILPFAAVQCLNLSGHVVSDAAAQIMSGIMSRLRSLHLSGCLWTAAGGLQLINALGESVRLESLCMDSLQLSAESCACLAHVLRNAKSLRVLKLNKIATADGVQDFLAAMDGLTHIEEIELEGWRMADGGVEHLMRLVPLWKNLRKISLSKNFISDQSGDEMLEALRGCTRLEELRLSSNNLGDVSAARMALVLPSLTCITVLDISENHIGRDGSVSLSKAIMCLKNLKMLHLTSVGTPELCAVAASLTHCPLIQDIRLGWNNCGDKVAEELARVMPHSQKLTIIDLESNSVTVTGGEALIRALQSCPALQLIRLWRNNISLDDAQRLSLRDRRLSFSPT